MKVLRKTYELPRALLVSMALSAVFAVHAAEDGGLSSAQALTVSNGSGRAGDGLSDSQELLRQVPPPDTTGANPLAGAGGSTGAQETGQAVAGWGTSVVSMMQGVGAALTGEKARQLLPWALVGGIGVAAAHQEITFRQGVRDALADLSKRLGVLESTGEGDEDSEANEHEDGETDEAASQAGSSPTGGEAGAVSHRPEGAGTAVRSAGTLRALLTDLSRRVGLLEGAAQADVNGQAEGEGAGRRTGSFPASELATDAHRLLGNTDQLLRNNRLLFAGFQTLNQRLSAVETFFLGAGDSPVGGASGGSEQHSASTSVSGDEDEEDEQEYQSDRNDAHEGRKRDQSTRWDDVLAQLSFPRMSAVGDSAELARQPWSFKDVMASFAERLKAVEIIVSNDYTEVGSQAAPDNGDALSEHVASSASQPSLDVAGLLQRMQELEERVQAAEKAAARRRSPSPTPARELQNEGDLLAGFVTKEESAAQHKALLAVVTSYGETLGQFTRQSVEDVAGVERKISALAEQLKVGEEQRAAAVASAQEAAEVRRQEDAKALEELRKALDEQQSGLETIEGRVDEHEQTLQQLPCKYASTTLAIHSAKEEGKIVLKSLQDYSESMDRWSRDLITSVDTRFAQVNDRLEQLASSGAMQGVPGAGGRGGGVPGQLPGGRGGHNNRGGHRGGMA